MSELIRIGLIHPSQLKLRFIHSVIQQFEQYKIIFETLTAQELLRNIEKYSIDLILIHFQMSVVQDHNQLMEIKARQPRLKVILLSLYQEPDLVWQYFHEGVHGIIMNASHITSTIDQVISEGYHYSMDVFNSISKSIPALAAPSVVHFSTRELAIIQCICNEMTSQKIAESLFISKRTVDWHRKQILEKINTKSSIGIVKYAIKNGLFDL